VVDRTFAGKMFADADPVGRQVLVQPREGEASEPFTIVGVLTEMKPDLFDLNPRPHLYAPHGAVFRAFMTLHVRTAPGVPDAAMLATIRRGLVARSEAHT